VEAHFDGKSAVSRNLDDLSSAQKDKKEEEAHATWLYNTPSKAGPRK
jgi:hypothetical protein